MQDHHSVVTIGNAIVDVLTEADDAFIERHDLARGAMTLIDADQATTLYEAMGPGIEISGGSAANTAAGVATMGGTAGYIGKVCDDQLGTVFRHDIRAAGVTFETAPITGEPPTARSLILVTPDGQRTMNTYLGACVELGPADVDEAMIAGAQVTYLEGYLWDRPTAKEAFVKAATIAHEANRRTALTLSDTFCVERHRDSFLELLNGHIDILFANEHELEALYQTSGLEPALDALRDACEVAAITRGENGSMVITGGGVWEIPAKAIGQIVDTTGAGDLYAAGFLHALTLGLVPADCAHLGSVAAAEIIGHFGARPQRDLADLIAAEIPG